MTTRKVTNLNLQTIGRKDRSPSHYAGEHFFITRHDFRADGVTLGQPYRVDEGRVVMVTHGWVRISVNLEEQLLQQRSLVVIMPDSIFEIHAWSDDFDMQAFSFKDLPIFTSIDHQQTFLQLDDDECRLAQEYFELMWHETQRQPLLIETITYLQSALLLELKRIANRRETEWEQSATRQDKTFHQFLYLIRMYGLRERKIDFYADRLCVTPNHLGAVIKKASGLTVMQWLNRLTVQKAKVLLRYSDLPIWEIAERMNFANPSFFSKFFKKEAGTTPGEYRAAKNAKSV